MSAATAMVSNLLSGLLGSVVGALVTVWHQSRADRARGRADLTMEVATWIGATMRALNSLVVGRDQGEFRRFPPAMVGLEYFSTKTPPVELMTRVEVVLGKGDLLQLIDDASRDAETIFALIMSTDDTSWAAVRPAIDEARARLSAKCESARQLMLTHL